MIFLIMAYVLSPIWGILSYLRRRRMSTPHRILLVQTAKIGDMICTFPLINSLAHTNLTLAHASLTRPLVEGDARISRVVWDSSNWRGMTGKFRLWRFLWCGRFEAVIFVNVNLPWLVSAALAAVPIRMSLYPDVASRTMRGALRFLTHVQQHQTGQLLLNEWRELFAQFGWTVSSAHDPDDTMQRLTHGQDIHALQRRLDERLQKQHKKLTARECYEERVFSPPQRELPARHDEITVSLPFNGQRVFALGIGAGNRFKALSLEKLSALARDVHHEFHAHIFLIGNSSEFEQGEHVRSALNSPHWLTNLAGICSLNELPFILRRCQMYLGVDSGITYLADAVGVCVVSMVGPTDYLEQRPLNPCAQFIVERPSCYPCSRVYRTKSHCARGDVACLKFEHERVLEKIRERL